MTYNLKSTETEHLTIPGGDIITVGKIIKKFKKWDGEPIDDYGGKQILEFNNQPVFAELLVLNLFKKEGWKGVWVDSYKKQFRDKMSNEKNNTPKLSEEAESFFKKITEKTGFKGCWDIFLWKENNFLFVECKRNKKDNIRNTQLIWLETCLKEGLKPENFILFEWDVN